MIELIKQVAKIDYHTGQEVYFEKLLELLCEHLKFESAIAIGTFDTPKVLATRKLDKRQTDGLFSLIIESKVSATITHINETLPPPWGEISRYHFRNLLSLPLGTKKNLQGYVGLLSKKRRAIADDEYDVLETLTTIINQGYNLNKMYTETFRNDESTTNCDIEFAEKLQNGIISCDRTGKITYVNQALVNFLGSPSKEQTRMINLLSFPPLVKSGIAGSFKNVIETGTQANSTHTYTSKWGKTIYARLEISPILDSTDKVTGAFGQIIDITDTKTLIDTLEGINDVLSGLLCFGTIEEGLAAAARSTRTIFQADMAIITKRDKQSGVMTLSTLDCDEKHQKAVSLFNNSQDLSFDAISSICKDYETDAFNTGKNILNPTLIKSDIVVDSNLWGSFYLICCNEKPSWENTHQAILNTLCKAMGSFIYSTQTLHLFEDSERKKALILEAFPDLQYIISSDSTIIHAPKRNKNIPPVFQNLSIGRRFTDILNKEEGIIFSNTVIQAQADGNLWHMEFSLNEKDSPREVECRIIPHGDDKLLLFVRDITARKSEEKILQSAYSKMSEIIARIPDILIILDVKDGKITQTSKGTEKFLGSTIESIVGRNVMELSSHINDDNRLMIAKKIRNHEAFENLKVPIHMDSGESITTLMSADYVDINNRPCALISVRDISAIEKSDEVLSKHMQRYKHLTENAPIGIAITNNLGQIIEVNPAAVSICGGLLELMGTGDIPNIANLQELIQPEIRETLAGRKTLKTIEVSGEDNDSKHLRFNLAPIDDETKNAKGVIIMFEDVSEVQNSINKINKAQQDAQKAGLAKNEFLANMSHEIRTPLNALLGFTQLLKNEETTNKIKDYVDSINTAGEALNFLTSDLLDITRIEAGRFSLYLEPSNIFNTFEQVRTILGHRIKDSGNEVILNISDDISTKFYMFDSSRLKQILINLLGNALKFTSNGVITVDINSSPNDNKTDNINIIIDDTGIGIPKTMHELVFQPFTQIDSSTSKKFSGSGLGLAIVKGIIDAMGGDISIVPKETAGARFQIVLPFEVATDVAVSSENEEIFNEESLSGLKVLVAEDNSLNVKLITEILKNLGCEITICTTGQKVVERAQNREFDVCLMDIQMPDLSGLDATMQIRYFEEKNNSKHLPIIAMTAYASVSDRDKCIKAGMDSYIAKPIKIPELVKTVCSIANISSESQINKLSRQLMISPQKLSEILTEYATGGIESLKEIESLLFDDKWGEVCDICHKLKGMAYMEPITSLVANLHSNAKKSDKKSTLEFSKKLIAAYKELLSQLQ